MITTSLPRRSQNRVCAFSSALLLLLVPGCAFSQTLHYTTVQVPGAQNTYVLDVSTSGVLLVNYTDSAGTTHCETIAGTTHHIIKDPNEIGTGSGKGTTCSTINRAGQIVGSYSTAVFGNGFLYSAGTYTDISVPTQTAGTIAYGLNDKGEIVGEFSDNVGTHGFTYNGTVYTTLDYPGTNITGASGVNNFGVISGFEVDSVGVVHGWTLRGGTYILHDAPGATSTFATAINDSNQILLEGPDSTGAEHGYIITKGVTTEFGVAGAFSTFARGLNDNGVIAGGYSMTNGGLQVGYYGRVF